MTRVLLSLCLLLASAFAYPQADTAQLPPAGNNEMAGNADESADPSESIGSKVPAGSSIDDILANFNVDNIGNYDDTIPTDYLPYQEEAVSDLEADFSVHDDLGLQSVDGVHDYGDEDTALHDYGDDKGFTYTEPDQADEGEYKLLNLPTATINFNDSRVNTISTLGNIGLVIGGLYLLSGFSGGPTNLANTDPLGLKRRFPSRPPPRFQRISHKTGESIHHKKVNRKRTKPKKGNRKHPRHQRVSHKQGLPAVAPARIPMPARSFKTKTKRPVRPTAVSVLKERQLLRPVPIQPLRPIRLRMPSLPTLPNIRRPTFAPFNNPFRRPVNVLAPLIQRPAAPVFNRPTANRPAPAASRPSPAANRPAPAANRPAPAANRPAPAADRPTPAANRPPPRSSRRPRPRPTTEDSGFRDQENPILPEPITFNSPFEADPFSEFRNAEFGESASFRELLDGQFGDFTFDKIKRKSD